MFIDKLLHLLSGFHGYKTGELCHDLMLLAQRYDVVLALSLHSLVTRAITVQAPLVPVSYDRPRSQLMQNLRFVQGIIV